MILHEIFREVSCFPRNISCYIAECWFPLGQCGSHTVRKVLADFAVCNWSSYCKALCDVKVSQIEENGRTFRQIEPSNSIISYISNSACSYLKSPLYPLLSPGQEAATEPLVSSWNASQAVVLHFVCLGWWADPRGLPGSSSDGGRRQCRQVFRGCW